MSDSKPQIHNRFKLPMFLVSMVAGAVLLTVGVITGHPELVPPGAVIFVVAIAGIFIIATRRGNPWWMRSDFDPPATSASAKDSESDDRAPVAAASRDRGRYIFAFAGSVAFVLAGIALVGFGAAMKRWNAVGVGVATILVFGTFAWIGLSALRKTI